MTNTNVLRLVSVTPKEGSKDRVTLALQTICDKGYRILNPLTARHSLLVTKLTGIRGYTKLLPELTEEATKFEEFGKSWFFVADVIDELGETPIFLYDLWVETEWLEQPLNDNHKAVNREIVTGKDAKGNDKVETVERYPVNRVVGLGEED